MYKPVKTNTNLMNQQECIATSSKYKVIPIQEIVNRFEAQGFATSAYQESNFRKEEKRDKVRHYLRMKLDTNNGVDREIVIMNSYDSSTSLRLHFGITRLVRNNGIILSEDFIPSERIKHTSLNPFDRIDNFINVMKSKLYEEAEMRLAMENKYLSHYDMYSFAEKAILLRENIEDVLDVNELNIAVRLEDLGKNLWLTFNRIQSALVNGTYQKLGTLTNKETDKTIQKYRSAKKLTDGNKLIGINEQLHSMAMSYL